MRWKNLNPQTRRRWKRADVTTNMLVAMIDRHGVNALDMLHQTNGIPAKVLVAAVHRDTRREIVNWGVSPWRPFLDTEGMRIVREAKEARSANSQGGRGHRIGGAGGSGDKRSGAGGAGRVDLVPGARGGAGREREEGSEHRRVQLMNHEIENGRMIHEKSPGNTTSHDLTDRCGLCPTSSESPQSAGTAKVSAWFADTATGLIEQQEVTGTHDVVAAWLRALADRIAPPRPAVRLPHDGQPGARRGRGLDVLPPARH